MSVTLQNYTSEVASNKTEAKSGNVSKKFPFLTCDRCVNFGV